MYANSGGQGSLTTMSSSSIECNVNITALITVPFSLLVLHTGVEVIPEVRRYVVIVQNETGAQFKTTLRSLAYCNTTSCSGFHQTGPHDHK
jgi:hypothetical protein